MLESEFRAKRDRRAEFSSDEEGMVGGGYSDDDAEELFRRVERGRGEDGDGRGAREIYDEVIAKSKDWRRERQRAREEGMELTDKLDEELVGIRASLLAGSRKWVDERAAVKPAAAKKKKVVLTLNGPKEVDEDDDDGGIQDEREVRTRAANAQDAFTGYDVLRGELTQEARARPSDRLKTEMELAEEEKARLEGLERERVARMRGERVGDAARKNRSGDDLEDDFMLDENRAKSKKKGGVTYGGQLAHLAPDASDDDDDSGGDGGDDGDDDEEEKSSSDGGVGVLKPGGGRFGGEDSEDMVEPSSSDEGPSEDEVEIRQIRNQKGRKSEAVQDARRKAVLADSEEENGSDDGRESEGGSESDGDISGEDDTFEGLKLGGESDGEDDGSSEESDGSKKGIDFPSSAKKPKAMHAVSEVGEGERLPYTPAVPNTRKALLALLPFDATAAEFGELCTRIRAVNTVHADPANKGRMQSFYLVLHDHFGLLLAQRPLSKPMIDAVAEQVIVLARSMPLLAAKVGQARVRSLSAALSGRRRSAMAAMVAGEPQGGEDADGCWPSVRALTWARLWSKQFPPSDQRHPVITPLSLLLAESLMLSPVRSLRDLALGLLTAEALHDLCIPARRFAPEVFAFLTALLSTAVDADALPKEFTNPHVLIGNADQPRWLQRRGDVKTKADAGAVDILTADYLASHPESSHESFSTNAFRQTLHVAALKLAHKVLLLHSGAVEPGGNLRLATVVFSALPQAMTPMALAVGAHAGAKRAVKGPLADAIAEHENILFVEMKAAAGRAGLFDGTREPLAMHRRAVVSIKEYAPRFGEDARDPDPERKERKKMKRAHTRELKGAMRELRKDSAYLAEQKAKAWHERDIETQGDVARGRRFLDDQQSELAKAGGVGIKLKRNKKRR